MSKTTFKFGSIKDKIYSAFESIGKTIKSTNSKVTMTVKNARKIQLEIDQNHEDSSEIQDLSQFINALENQEEESSQINNYSVRIETKDVLPNIFISEHHSDSSSERNNRKQRKSKPSIFKLSRKELSSKEIIDSDDFNESIPDETSQYKVQKKQDKKVRIGSKKTVRTIKSEKSKFQKLKTKELDNSFVNQIDLSSDESYPQSCAIIENKLNEAWKYIKHNKIFQLEEFLYSFKTKYMYFNEKVQIKWRLLMAFCKENRKQYQRASILYSQVIQIVKESPNLLSLDLADIYHRLGICYAEIRVWNQGILAFTTALNEFKMKNKRIKYAQCANNLGTLYLNAGSISEAEKCFLLSYSIKQNEYSKNSSRKLLSSLFNLYECNIVRRNYDQASKILQQLEKIVLNLRDNKMLLGGIWRRKGKLSFLKGDLDKAEDLYNQALAKLQKQYPCSLQFGQLLNNIGLLKLDCQFFSSSKEYFNQSLVILNFYYTKDSIQIQTIKRNIDLIDDMIKKKRKVQKKAASFKDARH